MWIAWAAYQETQKCSKDYMLLIPKILGGQRFFQVEF